MSDNNTEEKAESIPPLSAEAKRKVKKAWDEGTAGIAHESGSIHHGPPFPPAVRASADAFFAYKAAHPEIVPYEELTPLQKRMQDGFAYPEPPKK